MSPRPLADVAVIVRTPAAAAPTAALAGSLAAPGELPVPAEALRPGAVVLDAVYRPLRTPLLQAAVARGCTAVPGGEWFVRQAAAQFHEFTQSPPDEALMRAAFEHALDDALDDAQGDARDEERGRGRRDASNGAVHFQQRRDSGRQPAGRDGRGHDLDWG